MRSVQEVRQALAGRADPGILGAGDLEEVQQPGAHGVLGLLVRAAQQVQQSREGVLDVAAEHVEIGHEQLRLEVRGRIRGRLPGRGEISVLGAAHELDGREARLRLGVGRALLELPTVGRDGGVEIAPLDGLLGLGEQRGQRLLRRGLLALPLALGQLHALLAGDLEDLREQALDLRLGQHGVDDRLQLALQEQQQGGQLLDAQRSRDPLLGVGVDDGQAQRPALGVDPAAQGGEIGLALGDPAAGDEQERGDRLRVGDELLEALLGDWDLVRGGLAGPRRRGQRP